MTCRSGCPTGGHASWGECARAANLVVAGVGESAARTRAWDNDLRAYREARAQGIQPASTRRSDVEAAVSLSRDADRPFDANRGGFR